MFDFFHSLFQDIRPHETGGKPLVSRDKKSKSVTSQPAPVTRTKAVAVLETDEESTDLLPQETIRSEVNFLTLPFFALSRKDAQTRMTSEYQTTVRRGDERLDVSWIVSANPRYGYPRPFDGQVHKAIEYIISNLERPIENPVPIGSLYRIGQLLNLKRSGRLYDDIKAAIQRIVTTSIESKGTFYGKGRKRWREATFHLYEKVVFIGEELDNGEVADTNYVYFDNWYLDSINARYTKPLDYTYYRTLQSPIASRLYELLGVKFYGMGHNPFIRYKYSTLCQLLPVTRYQYLSKAKEKLEPAHQELINTGFLNKVEWERIEAESRDWYVCYYPGTRAREEIKRFSKQVALPPPDDSVQATAQPAPATPTEQVAEDVASALQAFGISKKQALRLAKDYPQEHILAKLDMVKWLIDTKSPLVSKNPQGFLIHAIQDDYPIPPRYKSQKQQEVLDSEEQEARREAQEEYRKAKEEAHQRLLEQHPPQPIENTDLTTASAWTQALAHLQEQVPQGTFAMWLRDTLLVRLENNTAYVLVASRFARDYLERRLYASIARTLEQVIGYEVEVEFVVSDSIP